MEKILKLVNINEEENDKNIQPILDQGYIYTLISVRTRDYVCIGKTINIKQRLRSHNSGNGSVLTEPAHLSADLMVTII